MWGRACSRRGRHIQHRFRLSHRFREQARSHRGFEATTEFVNDPGTCRSRLAGDGSAPPQSRRLANSQITTLRTNRTATGPSLR
jgi:hypothetical protein